MRCGLGFWGICVCGSGLRVAILVVWVWCFFWWVLDGLIASRFKVCFDACGPAVSGCLLCFELFTLLGFDFVGFWILYLGNLGFVGSWVCLVLCLHLFGLFVQSGSVFVFYWDLLLLVWGGITEVFVQVCFGVLIVVMFCGWFELDVECYVSVCFAL